MSFQLRQAISSSTLSVLILEGLAIIELGLALTADYYMDTVGSPPPSAIWGALLLFCAAITGIIAAIILLVNVIKNKINIGTIVAMIPFLGFAIWGIWYSYTDLSWAANVPVYWAVLSVIIVLWLYTITKYLKQKGS